MATKRVIQKDENSKLLPINTDVKESIIPLITIENRPKVNRLTGSDKRVNIGRIKIFSKPNIMAAPIATQKLET